MANDTMFEFIRGTIVAVVLGILGGISKVPWIQIGTFLTLVLNFSYVIYKWRKSHQYNKINLRIAANNLRSSDIDLEMKEETLRQLKKSA